MELDSTAKLSEEIPKSAVDTTMNPLEKPSKSERKWLRMVKRETNDGCAVQGMDQRHKNMYDIENGKNGMIAEPCSPDKPAELDSTAKLSQENSRSGGDTLTNPLEKLSKSKRKRLRKERKLRSESMDHMKSGGDTLANPLMKLSKSKRKRLRKARKMAASKLAPESMDHTNIISNLSLADASDAYAGDNINNGSYLSQESRCSTGNGICEKVLQGWDSWPEVLTSFHIQVFPAPQGCEPDLGTCNFEEAFLSWLSKFLF